MKDKRSTHTDTCMPMSAVTCPDSHTKDEQLKNTWHIFTPLYKPMEYYSITRKKAMLFAEKNGWN